MNPYNSGVKAIAQGLLDAGAEAAFNYPGFFSQDIFDLLGGNQISLNERIAYAEAFGASLAGKRAVVSFKNVGLNIACDAYFHSIISGVRSGLVVIVSDDVDVWGSQESQDSRPYFDFYGGIWLEPSTAQEGYDFGKDAFELSEEFDVPVVIRLTNDYFDCSESFKKSQKRRSTGKPAGISREKFLVHPYYFKHQYANLQKKNNNIRQYFNKRKGAVETQNKDMGVITVGAAKIPKSALASDRIHINTYPFQENIIKDFIEEHHVVKIYECGGPYIANKIRQLDSKKHIYSDEPTNLAQRTDFITWNRYDTFFKALQNIKPDMVFGDITQFTADKNQTIKASLSFGTAFASSIGYSSHQPNSYVFCLSGDSSFLHEGIGIIDEAIKRDVKLGIVIFDNGGSWCTGGQTHAGNIYNIDDNIKLQKIDLTYELITQQEIETALLKMKGFNGVSLLRLKVDMGDFSWDE